VENRVNDELNLLVVRRDMEKSQPDCLEQYKLDILKKSQPNCLEQSQSDCQKQTVKCVRCGYTRKEYKRGRLKKRLENHLLKYPAIVEVEEEKQRNGVCDADPKEEPEILVPEPVHAPKSVPPDDTHADSDDNDEVSNVGCEANKFITSSGTGPLYKYLRHEVPTAVGVMAEVDVFDTGGTMKTDDNPDVTSKPVDPHKPNAPATSNVESLCIRKTHLECKRQHSTRPPDKTSTLHTLDVFEPKKMTDAAMVISQDADEEEKLAKSENKAIKFDAALREILDTAAANSDILEKTTRLLKHDTAKALKAGTVFPQVPN
jgi:hypothetical protein